MLQDGVKYIEIPDEVFQLSAQHVMLELAPSMKIDSLKSSKYGVLRTHEPILEPYIWTKLFLTRSKSLFYLVKCLTTLI